MKFSKALVRGSIGVAAGLPLALQLVMPAAASARPLPIPEVLSVSPNSGPASGGTTVTITGDYLTYAGAVLFGGVPASYTIVSNAEIIATSPAESAVTVAVQVKSGPAVEPSDVGFTYS